MTPEERLNEIIAQSNQRLMETGQEESMQQLFMKQLQTTELDDAGWLCLLHQLLRVSIDSDNESSTSAGAGFGNTTTEQFPAMASQDTEPTPFSTSQEAASWIVSQLPKEYHQDYDPLDALWLAFQGVLSPADAADKLRRYGVIASNN